MPEPTPIRDAATIVLYRIDSGQPHVLMGQRGAGAVFMPSKFVFPGGRVDVGDNDVPLAGPLVESESLRLRKLTSHDNPSAFAVAAIRELWEETGLRLGCSARDWQGPEDWSAFGRDGIGPDASALTLLFRAITPPGRPRRFDARFFIAKAEAVADDVNDFSRADDELSHLRWIPLDEARGLDLPFITEVVLAEVAQYVQDPTPRPIPFFDHTDDQSVFRTL